jgi:ADP-ribosylation factor related protein 1
MFGLIYGLFEQLLAKREYSTLILGLDNAGKTTLLEHLKSHPGAERRGEPLSPGQVVPTVGLNIGRLETGRERIVLWDLGGQSGLRSIWPKYYTEAHGLLYLIDAADEKRFDESCSALQSVLADLDDRVPVAILLNKQDTARIEGVEQMKGTIGRLAATWTRPSALFPICALNGDGVDKVIQWLLEQLRESKANSVT